MNPAIITLICLAGYVLAFRFYGGWLGRSVFGLTDRRSTPAHDLQDGIDYVPTNRYVLFGHSAMLNTLNALR